MMENVNSFPAPESTIQNHDTQEDELEGVPNKQDEKASHDSINSEILKEVKANSEVRVK